MSLLSPTASSSHRQENPQSNKKDALDSLDTSCEQGQDLPSEQNKGASLDRSQCSPSPASQEDPDSEISEDSDQEVDIEGDKGYFNAGWQSSAMFRDRTLE
jgi:homeobox protein HEX